MKDFDKETMLAWSWAMEHPIKYTLIEIMTSTPMIVFALAYGAVTAYLNHKSKKSKGFK